MKRLSLVLLSCSTALQGPPRVTSCTRRPATDDAAEVPTVIEDETLERELPIDFGSSDTQWTFEWPAVDDEPWGVRDVAGGGAMFAACHIASGALGAPIAVRLAGTGALALLEKGAAVDAKNEDGDTPLTLACQEGHVEVAQLLLERGADHSPRDGGGWTPLHLAAEHNRIAALRMLLDAGVPAPRPVHGGRHRPAGHHAGPRM